MNKGIKTGSLIISLMLIIIGCTHKTNLTGTSGQEGPEPIETEITSEMFTEFYSFEDSIRNFNSDNLILGNYLSNDFDNIAVTLLKFTSLVDTFDQVEDVKLKMQIKERHNFEVIDNTTLKIGKIKTNWFEAVSTWNTPTDSTTWEGDDAFSLLHGEDIEYIEDLQILTEGDTLIIELPEEILQDWILADTLNYGLALFTEEDDSFIEFYSSEYSDDHSPKLYFDYTETAEDTLVNYYRTPTHDLHIYETDNEFTVFEDRLIISDIQPIRMLLKFDIPNTIFIDASNTIDDTLAYLERLTINRADLVLSYECDMPYPLDTSINIDPFIMLNDTLNLDNSTVPMIETDDFEDLYITSSNDSLTSDAFKIDITKIMQNIVSGEYENYGIMLKSIYENKDFKHTEFDLEPKITIIFTPPFLED